MDIKRAVDVISRFGHLQAQEAEMVMNQIMRGEATDSQIGAYLMGLRMKGETQSEITGTVSQQAAWLAQAAALASQSGRVRMMIVWNVDFTNYGADPQAGYAIVRPNGQCPACNTMRAAMGG